MLKFNSPIIQIPKEMLLKNKNGQKVYNTLKKNGGLTSVKNKKSINIISVPGNQIKIISPGDIVNVNEAKINKKLLKKLDRKVKKSLNYKF